MRTASETRRRLNEWLNLATVEGSS